ncbi:MAG: TolC family protein [Acidobacteriota bacterium]|nr:TolC family protein [Acidobacteriota bacterium]
MFRLVLAGLIPALCTVSGAAQSATSITEAEFLALLDSTHPAWVESAEELGVARARARDVALWPNPELDVLHKDLDQATQETEWSLAWQLPHLGRRSRVDARERAAGAAELRLQQTRLELRLELREVYARWALAEARRLRLESQAQRVEGLARREAARAERGETSGLERDRLQLLASQLRSRVAVAAVEARAARGLAAGWFPSLAPEVDPELPNLPKPPALLPEETAASEHPRVRAAQEEVTAATLERRAAGYQLKSPELAVGWQRVEDEITSISGPTIGLTWSLPLFDRGQVERARADARLSAARARLERARSHLQAGRDAARDNLGRLVAAARAAEAAVSDHRRMLDGAEAAFRQGEGGLTDLLETHRAVTEAQLTVLELYEQALAAERTLQRVSASVQGSQPSITPDS